MLHPRKRNVSFWQDSARGKTWGALLLDAARRCSTPLDAARRHGAPRIPACLATHLLGIERVYVNGIAVGSGTVRAAHGVLPVPAPATAALLRGIPVRTGGLTGERTTPTGAALVRTLGYAFDEPVSIETESIGYGAGTRDDPDVPNLLRVMVGELRQASSHLGIWELQCQLDTATGEQVGWLLDALLQRGAVDAFATPVTMKKGRPGLLITVLCDEARKRDVSDLLLEESTSLGVREHHVGRRVLERWQEARSSEFGEVLFKVDHSASSEHVIQLAGVYTVPSARRKGLARDGMVGMVSWALERVPTVTLYVDASNTPAIRLYEALGFEERSLVRSIWFAD